MKPNRLKRLLAEGQPALGMWADLGSPAIVEAMAELPLDWILLDAEHGVASYEDMQPLLQAMSRAPAAAVVRVPTSDLLPIKRVLDMGAEGVLVPQVRDAEEVARVVAACRYPPEGGRGIGPFRASRYDMDFMDYYRRANQEILVIVQIENRQALANLEPILAVPGLDAVFVGPADLALDMGHFPDLDHEAVQGAIGRIREAARRAGKPAGFYCSSGRDARRRIAEGFQMVSVCSDLSIMAGALRRELREARGERPPEGPEVVTT